jgi:oligopeptidase A
MHGMVNGTGGEPHLAVIVANVTPPVEGNPALLARREVETLFHEFGHLLHHCLSEVEVKSLAGTQVATDFVELPSKIMENWCWEKEALDMFARHFQTDRPIPASLFDKMIAAKCYRAANMLMRQLGFAAVDLALHTDYAQEKDGDAMDYARKILDAHSPVRLPPEHAMIAAFTHLFADPVGYAAGYYSYQWSEVLDADAFTRFRDQGLFDREVGEAFRARILARGNSEDPMVLYKSFMGREPRVDALLKRAGLSA